jgi:hypothetical protein
LSETRIEALEREATELRRIISECAAATGAGIAPNASVKFMAKLPEEIRLDRARLTEALKPFARVSDHIPSTWEDIDGVSRTTELTSRVYVTVLGENAGNVTVGDFRHARAALSPSTNSPEK